MDEFEIEMLSDSESNSDPDQIEITESISYDYLIAKQQVQRWTQAERELAERIKKELGDSGIGTVDGSPS